MGERDEVKEDVYGCEITKWVLSQDKQGTRPQLEPRAGEKKQKNKSRPLEKTNGITGLERR